MKSGSPAFSFYPKDYESDEHVKLMSLEQEGAYLRLLCHSWLHGSIPAELGAMARICRVAPAKMAKLWPGILPCWHDTETGRLVNGRLERQREQQAAWSNKQSQRGKKGAAKRWPAPSTENGHGHSVAIAQALPADSFPFPSPFPSGETTERNSDVYSGNGQTAPSPSPSPESFKDPDERTARRATERASYVQAVWSEWCKRKAVRLGQISSAEYVLICGWYDQGSPLRAVMQALEQTDLSNARSLLYLKGPVEQEAARVAAAMYS